MSFEKEKNVSDKNKKSETKPFSPTSEFKQVYILNRLSPILICYIRIVDFILAVEEDNNNLKWFKEVTANDKEAVLLAADSVEVLDASEIVEF